MLEWPESFQEFQRIVSRLMWPEDPVFDCGNDGYLKLINLAHYCLNFEFAFHQMAERPIRQWDYCPRWHFNLDCGSGYQRRPCFASSTGMCQCTSSWTLAGLCPGRNWPSCWKVLKRWNYVSSNAWHLTCKYIGDNLLLPLKSIFWSIAVWMTQMSHCTNRVVLDSDLRYAELWP